MIFNTGFYVFLVFVLVWSYLLGTTVHLSASCRWSKRTTCTDTWALFGQCAQLHVGGSVCFTFCPSSSSHDTLVPLSVRMDCLILSRVTYISSHLIMSSRGAVKVSSKPKWLRCMVPDLFLLPSVHVIAKPGGKRKEECRYWWFVFVICWVFCYHLSCTTKMILIWLSGEWHHVAISSLEMLLPHTVRA